MSNNSQIDVLRDSFNRIYNGPDRLRREYELTMEAERLGVHIDTYRRLYELRGEEEIDPYPNPKKWWHTPGEWGKWVWHLPPKKKFALGRKGVVKLVQSGVIITVALALGQYFLEAPKRVKQSHYQAWQMINSAAGQKTSGGRIEALQDLNKDDVSLAGLDASGANLRGINLQNANLYQANLSKANFNEANFINAKLYRANLSGIAIRYANLAGARLGSTNLIKSDLTAANLINADLTAANLSAANLIGANLINANLSKATFIGTYLGCITNDKNKTYCTNLKGVKNITPEEIKKVNNWQFACYDPDFRIKLGLPPQNPKLCTGEKHTK